MVVDDDGYWMLDYCLVEFELGIYSIIVKFELLMGQVFFLEQLYVFEYNLNLLLELLVYELGIIDFVICLSELGLCFGWVFFGLGDLNGDGFEDWVVSVFDSQFGCGEVIVVWGCVNEFRFELELFLSEVDGFFVCGLQEGDFLGESFVVGDFNVDGVDDLIMFVLGSDSGVINVGVIYVVWGLRGVICFVIDFN